jgi:hypothetical protein
MIIVHQKLNLQELMARIARKKNGSFVMLVSICLSELFLPRLALPVVCPSMGLA